MSHTASRVSRSIHKQLARLVVLLTIVPLSSLAATAATQPVRQPQAVITVTPTHLNNWAIIDESGGGGVASGQFVMGPDTPPLGIGSVELRVDNSSGGIILATDQYTNTLLSAITELSYSTYRSVPTSTSALAVALGLNVDYDLTDAVTSWQGRLNYEPYHGAPANTVQPNIWQTWNPLDATGPGRWWRSNTSVAPSTSCTQANPCTWDQVLQLWPNIGIHGPFGGIVFKAGSGWTSFVGNVDNFTIGINGSSTTYNFDADLPPTVLVNPTQLSVSEGGSSASYTVALQAEPTSPVTLTASVADSQIAISADDGATFTNSVTLAFDSITWSEPQTITVQAVDDSSVEGNHSSSIQHTLDPNSAAEYLALEPLASVDVAISDNDFSSDVVVVKPYDLHGWDLAVDPPSTDNDASGDFVLGPGTPPLGDGSVELSVYNTNGRMLLYNLDHLGTRFDTITELSYSTYRSVPTSTAALAASLSFNVDYDLTDPITSWQGRLTYEPYLGAPADTVQPNIWQTWNPLDAAGPGRWWRSNTSVAPSTSCTQANPCTWDQVLQLWPNMGIHATLGATLFKAGGGWPSFVGNVDNVSLGINNATTTYDFEPIVPGTIITPTTLAITEGGSTDSYTVTLHDPPTGPVTVTASVADNQSLISSNSAPFTTSLDLVFTALNWSEPQTITVQAVDDAVAEGSHTSVITHSLDFSSAPEYAAAGTPVSVTAQIADNDSAAVLISGPEVTSIDENQTRVATYSLSLGSAPTAAVVITAQVSDSQTLLSSDGVTYAPTLMLNFTSSTWATPQLIYQRAVDDLSAEPSPHQGRFTVSVDPNSAAEYSALDFQTTLSIDIIDNDQPGLAVEQSGGDTSVDETGPTTDTYTLALTTPPSAPVSITASITDGQTLISSDGVSFTTSLTLVFDDQTWSVPQTIYVQAVDDAAVEGSPHSGQIAHTISSADSDYAQLDGPTLSVSITDNDTASANAVIYLPLVLKDSPAARPSAAQATVSEIRRYLERWNTSLNSNSALQSKRSTN